MAVNYVFFSHCILYIQASAFTEADVRVHNGMPSCVDVNASHVSKERAWSGYSNSVAAQPSSTSINEEEFLEINDIPEFDSIMQSIGNGDAPDAVEGAFDTAYFDAPQLLAEIQQQQQPLHDGGLSEINIEDYFDATVGQSEGFDLSNELWRTLEHDTTMSSFVHANQAIRATPLSGTILNCTICNY